jgi:thioredoxin 1
MTNETDTARAQLVDDLAAATFNEAVLASPIPVVVDVWTAWCGPCKTLRPIVEDLAGELVGRMRFYKLDAEEHPDTARRFNVMSFPTLLVFRDGELVQRLIGARGRRHLLEELSHWL